MTKTTGHRLLNTYVLLNTGQRHARSSCRSTEFYSSSRKSKENLFDGNGIISLAFFRINKRGKLHRVGGVFFAVIGKRSLGDDRGVFPMQLRQ